MKNSDSVHAAAGGLTEYELKRQRRIEENQKRLLALGIIDTKNAIEKAAAAKRKPAAAAQRGLPKKRIAVPEAERRRSSRIKGDAADGNEVTKELRGGKVVTKDMVPAEPEGPHDVGEGGIEVEYTEVMKHVESELLACAADVSSTTARTQHGDLGLVDVTSQVDDEEGRIVRGYVEVDDLAGDAHRSMPTGSPQSDAYLDFWTETHPRRLAELARRYLVFCQFGALEGWQPDDSEELRWWKSRGEALRSMNPMQKGSYLVAENEKLVELLMDSMKLQEQARKQLTCAAAKGQAF